MVKIFDHHLKKNTIPARYYPFHKNILNTPFSVANLSLQLPFTLFLWDEYFWVQIPHENKPKKTAWHPFPSLIYLMLPPLVTTSIFLFLRCLTLGAIYIWDVATLHSAAKTVFNELRTLWLDPHISPTDLWW